MTVYLSVHTKLTTTATFTLHFAGLACGYCYLLRIFRRNKNRFVKMTAKFLPARRYASAGTSFWA